MDTNARDALEAVARPLLEIVHRVTGLETSFVTEIDWGAQTQQVVFARNTAELQVAEGSEVPWADSMCRWAFLSGKELTTDVGTDFPDSLGADLGMHTFFAVPVVVDDQPVGTVCGASRRQVELDDETLAIMRLVAQALTHQFAAAAEADRQRQRAEDAEVLALTDPLTGLPNRRAFTAQFEEELARAGRHGTGVALLLADIDEFKAVNDTYGHAGGDVVLVTLGEVLRRYARTEDVAARIGGDEFALLLASSSHPGAGVVAERIADAFRRSTQALGMPATISIGVSTSTTSRLRDLQRHADAALYEGKGGGRDRVTLHLSGSEHEGRPTTATPSSDG